MEALAPDQVKLGVTGGMSWWRWWRWVALGGAGWRGVALPDDGHELVALGGAAGRRAGTLFAAKGPTTIAPGLTSL